VRDDGDRDSATTQAGGTRGPAAIAAWLWWFFTSVRVGLWLIGTTIVWIIVATLAQSTFPGFVARHVPALRGLMDRWATWAVWESPLFLLTLVLLAVSIVCGGMVARWPGIEQRIWRPGIRTSTGFFRAVKQHDSIAMPDTATGVAAFTETLKRRNYRVLTQADARGATHCYADKNRYSLLATYPFHLGLVILMAGALIAATLGWREIGFLVPDGSTREIGHGTGLSVRSHGFVDAYYDDGRARDYYTDLDILKNGQVVKTGRLRVNTPVKYGGVTLHQATYGQAARFLVTDAATGKVLWDDSVPIFVSDDRTFARQFVDGAGEFEPTGVQRFDDLGVTLRIVGSAGALDEKIGVGQMAIALFDNRAARQGAGPIGTGKLDPGGSATIGGLTFTFQREVRFSGLQVTHNPGYPVILGAAILIFVSVLVTFYLPHRRIRALVTPAASGATMLLGAQVKLDIFGAREFEQIAREIRAAIARGEPEARLETAVAERAVAPVGSD
jgi:cytochrome c biogenesis protein